MKEAKRLSSLVNDMLDMSSLKSGIATLINPIINLQKFKVPLTDINEW